MRTLTLALLLAGLVSNVHAEDPEPPAPGEVTIAGQPSWRIQSPKVEAYLSKTGGHLAPVLFDLGNGKKAQPFSIPPWADDTLDAATPALVRVLRGDFFCLPFGGNDAAVNGEQHPPHGETANGEWALTDFRVKKDRTTIFLSLKTSVRAGRVDKRIMLRNDHSVVYQQHVVYGMTGAMPLGHHANLKFPDKDGSGLISTSRFVKGQVLPVPFETPEKKGYSALKPDATFDTLASVPTVFGGTADASRYPARRGYEDLLMVAADPSATIAWTAVVFPNEGWVWFSLKDPGILRNTVMWISNGGRHYAPWSGRHINVLGLEDVTAYFHLGLKPSVEPNPWSAVGFPTAVELNPDPKKPRVVNYIIGVAPIPSGFDRVKSIEPRKDRKAVIITSENGGSLEAPVELAWLKEKALR